MVAGEVTDLVKLGKEIVLTPRPGQIAGTVILEAPLGSNRPFDAGRVTQVALSLDSRSVPPGMSYSTLPNAAGAFDFPQVRAGAYRLRADLQGFSSVEKDVSIAPGEARSEGELRLIPILDATVEGKARRRCPDARCDHSGILVQTVGAPFVAVTGSDGDYLLSLTADDYRLRYSLSGHVDQEIDLALEPGDMTLPDVELVPKPAELAGVVLAGGMPAVGAAASLLKAGQEVANDVTADGGVLNMSIAAAAGNYTLRLSLPRYAVVDVPVTLEPGVTAQVGRIELPRRTGRITGRARRADDAARGGVTVLFEGDSADALTTGLTVRAVTTPPDDHYEVDLPAGAWRSTAVAADYRTPQRVDTVVPEGGVVFFDARLARRVHEVALPAVLGNPAVATFIRDPDLLFGRVWWDTEDAPDDLAFRPLENDESLTFQLDGEDRPYALRFQLANQEFLRDPADPFAAITPILRVDAILDTEAPAYPSVEIAGGSPEVHSLVVPVSFHGTSATTAAVWNDDTGLCADAPACGDAGMVPFADTLVHTFEPVEGEKSVCWLLCDEVCNCTGPGVVTTFLGDFRDRPTPTLSTLTPNTVEVHLVEVRADPNDPNATIVTSNPIIRLTGTGIADDTLAVIGAIELPCVPVNAPPAAAWPRRPRPARPHAPWICRPRASWPTTPAATPCGSARPIRS